MDGEVVVQFRKQVSKVLKHATALSTDDVAL